MTAVLELPGVRAIPVKMLPLALLSLAVGYSAVGELRVAVALMLLPLAVFVMLNPWWGVALAVALLPVLRPLIGSEGSAAIVSPADAFFLLAVVGLFPLMLLQLEWRQRLRSAKPLLVWCWPFIGWLVVVLVGHLSGHSAFKTMTALELTVLPLVLGAVVMDELLAKWAFYGFLTSASLLAVIWAADGGGSAFSGNKNAAGQYISDAILLVIVLAARRWSRYALLPLLVVGLLFAASRGAVVATAFGAISLLAVRGLGSWRRTAASVIVLSLVVIVGYNAVPQSVQQKVASISRGGGSSATSLLEAGNSSESALEYNVRLRSQYRSDGMALIRQHPLLGVGLGNYDTGSGVTRTIDPHNVLIRTAAEGGIPNAVLFVLMVVGTGSVVIRRLGRNRWAGAAIAMQVAILTHGFVDVYWIRGMPVLGWLLVGMSVNPRLNRAPVDG